MSDYLCEKLIIEIFTRLPAKSLLRFRSLSKSLCSYITSPDFIRMHSSRSQQKILIRHYICNKPGNKNFYTLHSADQLPLCPGYIGIKAVEFPYSRYCECVGSCNGILCLLAYKKFGMSLWNPSIRRKFKVPVPGCLHVYSIALGFGFDPITDDYKIVSIPGSYQEPWKSSYIYTMKTGTWCVIAPPAPSYYTASVIACFFNGALHWVVQSQRDSTWSDEAAYFYILTFNLSTHVFGKIELPAPYWFYNELTIIQGSLAVISTKRHGDGWIWVMKEYNNVASWSVIFKWIPNQVKVIGQLQREPTENVDLLCSTNWETFQVYDPKIRTLSRLQDLDADSSMVDIETCVESLHLLEKGTTCHGSAKHPFSKKKKKEEKLKN